MHGTLFKPPPTCAGTNYCTHELSRKFGVRRHEGTQ